MIHSQAVRERSAEAIGSSASDMLVVDAHAHFLGAGIGHASAPDADPRWPHLVVDEAGRGRIMREQTTFRQVGSSLWSVSDRLADLDRAGIDRQVISPVPITLTYWAQPELGLRFAQLVNDDIADACATSAQRLIGLGTVPLQDVDLAIGELERATGELGMSGVEIGACVLDKELDHADLLPFFEAAEALDVAIFIHPMDGGANAVRRRGQPYDFGLGMLTDTAMAAAALVFGGVLDHCPGLRIALAHGCGTFGWVYPRLRLAAEAFNDQDPRTLDRHTRSLWVDALVFDQQHLGLLTHRFGVDHLMYGSDHPFVPGQLEACKVLIQSAVADGALPVHCELGIFGRNALNWLKLT